ncbi:hypothetical protein O1R50_18480 [Glycomyces luteolus]|uniref:Uncharacterized protein n=1 Tax=Glycomyces luteolus TaxID=2670330 RepID=A0A9X3PCJ1_9ACTN|nr:hypothetical protein [Glycomyces luteolus]MDA1361621.1 hypothetical protein [Glycomyces luteolus]
MSTTNGDIYYIPKANGAVNVVNRSPRFSNRKLTFGAAGTAAAVAVTVAIVISANSGGDPVDPDRALVVSLVSNASVCGGLGFMAEDMEAAEPFLNTELVYSQSTDRFMEEALGAGAFALDEGLFEFGVSLAEGVEEGSASIHDIRPVEVEQIPEPVNGAGIDLVLCQGDEYKAMTMLFGAADPGPFIREEGDGTGVNTGKRFFDGNEGIIPIEAGDNVYVEMLAAIDDTAETAHVLAYAFKLEISYRFEGTDHTIVVDNDGQPFRIAKPPTCFDSYITRAYGGTAMLELEHDPALETPSGCVEEVEE